MLTRGRLVELFQMLRRREVLSVYVDAEQRDPAQRDAWRVNLDREVSRLRRTLEQERVSDLAGFDSAWALVTGLLRTDEHGSMTKRGWVAFATPDRIWHAGGVPAHMPSSVSWKKGMRAAPYVRALKQQRPVTVVLVDGRRARIFEQVEGGITELEGVLADADLGDLTDVGMRKASARSTGMRGETSTDQAQRLREVAAERMRKSLADFIDARVGQDGVVVVGGSPEAARKLVAILPRRLRGRVSEYPSLHLDMGAAEVREAIRTAAGDLSEHGHGTMVAEVVDTTRAGGKGAMGEKDTLAALEAKAVDTLLLSRAFIGANPRVADDAVGLAFVQGADVEEVSGSAGERLDRDAAGIAARLRFVPRAAG